MKFSKQLIIFSSLLIVTFVNSDDFYCYRCHVSYERECVSLHDPILRNHYRTKCDDRVCTNVLGQLGDIDTNYEERFNMQRACGHLDICNDRQAHCCTCNVSMCNGDDLCGAAYKIELNYAVVLMVVLNLLNALNSY